MRMQGEIHCPDGHLNTVQYLFSGNRCLDSNSGSILTGNMNLNKLCNLYTLISLFVLSSSLNFYLRVIVRLKCVNICKLIGKMFGI